MERIMFRKGLAFAFIILFIGVGVQPAIANNDDTTPPVTKISLNGTLSQHGIYSSEVEVTLNASDDSSGVNSTYYEIDGYGIKKYSEPFMINEHGMHTIFFWSVDNAGNVEEDKVEEFEIDLTQPYISLSYETLDNKSIEFHAFVSDFGSGPYKVEFFIDGEYKHTVFDSNEFIWIWNPSRWGSYCVSGIVYDRAENTDQDWIDVDVSRSKTVYHSLHHWLLECFPIWERLLSLML